MGQKGGGMGKNGSKKAQEMYKQVNLKMHPLNKNEYLINYKIVWIDSLINPLIVVIVVVVIAAVVVVVFIVATV